MIPSSADNEKKLLRKALIKKRRELDPTEKSYADGIIAEKLFQMPIFREASTVLIYVSTEIEVDTRRIIECCFAENKRVFTPISLDFELDFREIRVFSELKVGRYGILEPCDTSAQYEISDGGLCIVPALAVNDKKYRLGYGKGYYDRFLSGFGGVSASLCYKEFLTDIPTSENDFPTDFLITDRAE